jgi:hypothetical protein
MTITELPTHAAPRRAEGDHRLLAGKRLVITGVVTKDSIAFEVALQAQHDQRVERRFVTAHRPLDEASLHPSPLRGRPHAGAGSRSMSRDPRDSFNVGSRPVRALGATPLSGGDSTPVGELDPDAAPGALIGILERSPGESRHVVSSGTSVHSPVE